MDAAQNAASCEGADISARLTLDCPETSTTGAYRLSWSKVTEEDVDIVAGEDLPEVVLREGGDIVYRGTDGATTVTGQLEGSYEYTLQVGDSPETLSCTVAVEPPSLTLAFGLFAVGAVVFLSTCVLLYRGSRAMREEDAS